MYKLISYSGRIQWNAITSDALLGYACTELRFGIFRPRLYPSRSLCVSLIFRKGQKNTAQSRNRLCAVMNSVLFCFG